MVENVRIQETHLICEGSDETKNMYCRNSEVLISDEDDAFLLTEEEFYDFTTYFNSFSLEKWKQYTHIDEFYLKIDIKGEFRVNLVGHYIDGLGNAKRENIKSYYFNFEERKEALLKIPRYVESTVVAFQIYAKTNVKVYDAAYYGTVDSMFHNNPFITLVTTTYKKEKYIRKNYEILNDAIFADKEIADYFSWKIIDNGSVLSPADFNNEFVELIPNHNVGGSGGFCRGMMEALKQPKKPTHIILMDDDVCIFPESFRRILMLLTYIKSEYENYFISGAMLEMNQRNIQHEDVGMFALDGSHGPSKPRYDLNLWDSIIRNEKIMSEDLHLYSGWWFCCIPTSIARTDNLPLPFFVRGDDVEYSIRNNAKFITMNGICIWHEGFGLKFSGAMELYQVHRNDLILQTLNTQISDVKIIDRIKNLFWEELFKFNYKGCALLLDAVDDFLKGPEFIKEANGESIIKAKKEADNKLETITPEIRNLVDMSTLYENTPLTGLILKLYGHFVNGQKLPEILAGHRTAVIPYGWGYSQKKLWRTGTVYAVDIPNNTYIKYKRNKNKYKELVKRYNALIARFDAEYDKVADAFRSEETNMESAEFWNEYLNKGWNIVK